MKRILVALAIGGLLLFPLMGTVAAEPISTSPQPVAHLYAADATTDCTTPLIIGYDPGNSMLENALIENTNSFAASQDLQLAPPSTASQTYQDQAAQSSRKLENSSARVDTNPFAHGFPVVLNTLVDSFGGMANPALAVSGLTTDNSCIGQTAGYSAYVLLDSTDVEPRYLVTALKLPLQFASVMGEVIFVGTLTA